MPTIEGRNWDQATAMVIKGEAGVQAMGDWAKGEFRSASKERARISSACASRHPGHGDLQLRPVRDVQGRRGPPGRRSSKLGGRGRRIRRSSRPSTCVKGSVPARTDVPDTDFDACGKKGMKDLGRSQ